MELAPGVEADADEDFARALISASEIFPDARSLELRTEVAPGAIDREEDLRFFSSSLILESSRFRLDLPSGELNKACLAV